MNNYLFILVDLIYIKIVIKEQYQQPTMIYIYQYLFLQYIHIYTHILNINLLIYDVSFSTIPERINKKKGWTEQHTSNEQLQPNNGHEIA